MTADAPDAFRWRGLALDQFGHVIETGPWTVLRNAEAWIATMRREQPHNRTIFTFRLENRP